MAGPIARCIGSRNLSLGDVVGDISREPGMTHAPSTETVVVTEQEVQQRRPVSVLRAAKLVTSRGQLLCLVKSVAARSLVVHLNVPLAEGERVTIELGDDLVACTVSAVDGARLTLTFDEPADVRAWFAAPDAAQRRITPRVEVDCRARLQIGTQILFVAARDISQDGIRIESDELLLEGDEVIVLLRGWLGPLRGAVSWTDGNSAGVKFYQPLRLDDLAKWLASLNAAPAMQSSDSLRDMVRQ